LLRHSSLSVQIYFYYVNKKTINSNYNFSAHNPRNPIEELTNTMYMYEQNPQSIAPYNLKHKNRFGELLSQEVEDNPLSSYIPVWKMSNYVLYIQIKLVLSDLISLSHRPSALWDNIQNSIKWQDRLTGTYVLNRCTCSR
jgi:hypothetical protein